MHEDQDGVWYGRVTTNDEVFEELMLDSAGFAHDTGRRVRKKDREEVQPVIKWIEKSKKWNDWATPPILRSGPDAGLGGGVESGARFGPT